MRLSTLFEPTYNTAVAIVMDGDKWLLGKSTHKGDRNRKWCFPGGHMKRRETPEKCAERECYEETGIQCKVAKSAVPHKSKPGAAFVVCVKIGGDLHPNHEFSRLDWVLGEDLPQLPDIYKPNLEILKDIGCLSEITSHP